MSKFKNATLGWQIIVKSDLNNPSFIYYRYFSSFIKTEKDER
jgi:hypothetical protein